MLQKMLNRQDASGNTLVTTISSHVQRRRAIALIQPNLHTLSHLIQQNVRDFAFAVNKRHPAAQASRGLRRHDVPAGQRPCELLEETPIRWAVLAGGFGKAQANSRRMQDLEKKTIGRFPVYRPTSERIGEFAPRIAPPGPSHFGNAADLGRRLDKIAPIETYIRVFTPRFLRGQSPPGGVHSQALSQPGTEAF